MSLALLICGDDGFSCAKSTGLGKCGSCRTSTAISQNGFMDILALLRSTLDCIRTGVREASDSPWRHTLPMTQQKKSRTRMNKDLSNSYVLLEVVSIGTAGHSQRQRHRCHDDRTLSALTLTRAA